MIPTSMNKINEEVSSNQFQDKEDMISNSSSSNLNEFAKNYNLKDPPKETKSISSMSKNNMAEKKKGKGLCLYDPFP